MSEFGVIGVRVGLIVSEDGTVVTGIISAGGGFAGIGVMLGVLVGVMVEPLVSVGVGVSIRVEAVSGEFSILNNRMIEIIRIATILTDNRNIPQVFIGDDESGRVDESSEGDESNDFGYKIVSHSTRGRFSFNLSIKSSRRSSLLMRTTKFIQAFLNFSAPRFS